MHCYLKFGTKIIGDFVKIRGEVVVGSNMPDKDGVIALYRRALLLKAEVGIKVVDNPGVVERVVLSCH